jgi:cytochrome b6-f complex iron-sulfur subunit
MAEKTEAAASSEGESIGLNRRELLNYAWAASIALFMAQAGVVTYLFALPRFGDGEFGGTFTFDVAVIPPKGAPPSNNPEGGFWLSEAEDGALAVYKVCTHLGCLTKWVDTNFRFECPCHGSKFEIDGTYIEGPAPRDLDRFAMTALDADGTVVAESQDGSPLPLPNGTAMIKVDTGNRISGKPV